MSRAKWESALFRGMFYLYTDDVARCLNGARVEQLSNTPDDPIDEEIACLFPVLGDPSIDGPYRGAMPYMHALQKYNLEFDLDSIKGLLVWPELFDKAAIRPRLNRELIVYAKAATEFQKTLAAMNDEAIAKYFRIHEQKDLEGINMKREPFTTRNDRFEFFNRLNAEGDLALWFRIESWSADEFIALSLGKEPSKVNSVSLRLFKPRLPSPFRDEYERRTKFVERAILAGSLNDPDKPVIFVVWARRAGLDLPASMTNEESDLTGLSRALGKIDPRQAEYLSPEETRTQAVNSLYRIVLGIIIAKYKSAPDPHDLERQNDKYNNIYEDIQSVGIALDRDTLTKYLDRAYDYARRKNVFQTSRGKSHISRKT